MMEEAEVIAGVKHEQLETAYIISTLLVECSAITDYYILRDSLPRRLAHLLKCRAVLFYQKVEETLQFVAGSYNDKPGWSAALLSVVHINPVRLDSDTPETHAFTTRRTSRIPNVSPKVLAVPLVYRQRAIGVMVVIRSELEDNIHSSWRDEEVRVIESVADVVSLLLENTRLLERDQERIRELSFLNSISSQLNYTLYEKEYVHRIVVQRVREVTGVDLCELLEPVTQHELAEAIPWISSKLHEHLFSYFQTQPSTFPLIVECANASSSLQAFVTELPYDIKTFVAFPLLRPLHSKYGIGQRGGKGIRANEQRIMGIVVGAYYRSARLRREEVALLHVIGSQAGAALEHVRLVADVTEARNEARKLLRRVLEDQRLKELVFESIPSGLITMDMKGRITTFNRAASTILGYTPREVVGQSLHTLFTTARAETGRQEVGMRTFSTSSSFRVANLRTPVDRRQRGTLVTQNVQGQEVVLEVDMLPLRDARTNQLVGAVVTVTDTTSIHRLEEEMRRLDRLASLGEIAAGVAHEVRNPLASIKVSIQMLMDDVAEDVQEHSGQDTKHAWIQESASVILKEVERLDTIVRELLLFARPRQLHCSPSSLPQLCEHVLHLLQSQCEEAHITVQHSYSEVPYTFVDTHQIEQVLFNLFTNAIQAMPQGGMLAVAYQMDQRAQSAQAESHETPVSQWLEIRVTDTGVGIPEDQLERIFQPFFTTKAHGIGLGLSITRRLLEDHGGSLRVESRVGHGTTVALRLPVYNESAVDEEEYKDGEEHIERGDM